MSGRGRRGGRKLTELIFWKKLISGEGWERSGECSRIGELRAVGWVVRKFGGRVRV